MENENKAVRIGIVGCGRVAKNHVEAIQKTPNAVLTAAAGGRKASAFCEKYGLELLDTEDICTSPKIDALLVLTPWEKHYEYAKAALEAGKHVLVEKPVSFEPEEIKGMEQAADENKVVCMPGHSYLYLTELSRIRREVQNFPIFYNGIEFRCTLTLGLHAYQDQEGIEESIDRADKALYRGKRSGKNRSVWYENMMG